MNVFDEDGHDPIGHQKGMTSIEKAAHRDGDKKERRDGI
jgi:hypothetical protein